MSCWVDLSHIFRCYIYCRDDQVLSAVHAEVVYHWEYWTNFNIKLCLLSVTVVLLPVDLQFHLQLATGPNNLFLEMCQAAQLSTVAKIGHGITQGQSQHTVLHLSSHRIPLPSPMAVHRSFQNFHQDSPSGECYFDFHCILRQTYLYSNSKANRYLKVGF